MPAIKTGIPDCEKSGADVEKCLQSFINHFLIIMKPLPFINRQFQRNCFGGMLLL